MSWRNSFGKWIKTPHHRPRNKATAWLGRGERRLRLEPLEQRTLLTATLYVDFGDLFPGGVLNTTVDALDSHVSGANPNIDGPRLSDSTGAAFPDGTAVQITSLNNLYGANATALRSEMLELTRRFYEPLDITVVDLTAAVQDVNSHDVRAAANLDDISITLGVNEGDARNNDSYVIVGQFLIGATNFNPATCCYGGMSTGADIGGNNNNDGTAFVLLIGAGDSGQFNGDQIAHEAGHAFGLRHVYRQDTGNPPPPPLGVLGPQYDALQQSELMSYLSYDTQGGYNVFTRYPMMRGDGNIDPDVLAATPTTFDSMRNDPNIGPSPNVEYVTGTGSHDIITITKAGPAMATVTVEAFDDAAYTTAIDAPGAATGTTYTYGIDLANPLIIDAGGRNDRIILDGDLDTEITLRGMHGTDELRVMGKNAPTATYTPGTNTANGIDGNADLRGTITVGSTVIHFQEFEANAAGTLGNVTIQDVTNVIFTPPNNDALLTVDRTTTAAARIRGTSGGDTFVPLLLNNVETVFVKGTAGSDTLTVDSTGGLVTLRGGIRFDGGDGFDRLDLRDTGGTARTDSTISVGADPGRGRSVITDGGDKQAVYFENLEPITDSVPAGTFTINSVPGIASLLQDDNQINYEDAQILTTAGRVTVDNFEPIEFDNKDNLVIDAGAGDDVINLNNSRTPTGATPGGLKSITVNGDDATASDKVVVNGPLTGGGGPAGSSIDYTPTGTSSATIDITTGAITLPTIYLVTTEEVVINGQGGDDELTVFGDGTNRQNGTDDRFVHTPGAAADSGTVAVSTPTESLLPVTYVGLGLGATVTVDGETTASSTNDMLVALGTENEDGIEVDFTATDAIDVDLSTAVGVHVDLRSVQVESYEIRSLQGDDGVDVSAPIDISGTGSFLVVGGEPDWGSDVLHLAGADDTEEIVDIQPDPNVPEGQTIDGLGDRIYVEGMELIGYTGQNDDDALVVRLGQGVATARVQNYAMAYTDVVTSDVLPVIGWQAVEEFVLRASSEQTVATFVTRQLEAATQYTFNASDSPSTLVIEGSDGADDAYVVTDPTLGEVDVADVSAGTSVRGVNFADGDRLQINTLGGDDLVVVDVDGTEVIAVPITFDGGGGSDRLTIRGTPTTPVNDVTYTPGPDVVEGRLVYDPDGDGTPMIIDFIDLEPIMDLVSATTLTVYGTNAHNAINYKQGPQLVVPQAPPLPPLTIDTGEVSVDGFEIIQFANKTNLVLDGLVGDDRIDVDNPRAPDGLASITVYGRNGREDVTIRDSGGLPVTAEGGDGDDRIDGSLATAELTLRGGLGNDVLIGGSANDTIDGGDGDDLLIGNSGDNTYNGQSGFDTIGVLGTPGNDVIDVNQTGAAGMEVTVNGDLRNETMDNTEAVRVEADRGDDVIRVQHADALVDTPGASLRMEVVGDAPNASDRLIVVDDGLGDTVIQRVAPDGHSGTVTVGPLAPVVYEGIEYPEVFPLNPITGTTGGDGLGRLVVFKNDPYEINNALPVATYLGTGTALNEDPNIDPGGFVEFGVPGDQDWYQVVAGVTGTLDFQVFFEQIGELANGRAGLPGDGDLDIFVYDVDGTEIVGGGPEFGTNDSTSDERVRIPAVQGQTYYLRVLGHTEDAINNYNLTIVNDAAPVPYDLELDDAVIDGVAPEGSDTGRNNTDNVTFDNTPTIYLRLDDGIFLHDLPGNPADDTPPDEVIPVPFQAGPLQPTDPGYAIAVFDEGDTPGKPAQEPQVPLGFASATADPGVYVFTTPVLADGSHFLSARVQMIDPADPTQTGFGPRSLSLEIIVDTEIPPASFGDPVVADDGLHPDSDSDVSPPNPHTVGDRITNDTTPTFWGRAEADTIVRTYADVNDNGTFELGTDVYLGQATAIPLDGNVQEPDGYWEIASVVDLNDPDFFPVPDGLRTIFVTAEDVAGNVNAPNGAADVLRIFIDTQGPVIDDVFITGFGPADADPFDLFDPKDPGGTVEPTPLVHSLTIDFTDLPERVAPDFLYDALKQDVAEHPGHYLLVGDANGVIPIQQVIVTQAIGPDPVRGLALAAQATVELVFFEPLPDDRFTLTVFDEIVDPAGNQLDGESDTVEPQEIPLLPTGDGVPGGDFVARFTVDSRPEVGVWAAGSVYVDTNGNFSFDPENLDFTNRDIVYTMGFTSDDVFAGNFALNPGDTADGFDKLAAYGRVGGSYRWLVDTDNDGVPNLIAIDPANINGLPVAGEFDGNPNNGDEVGVFDGYNWWLDTDHNFIVDTEIPALPTISGLTGYPVVGDFNGDGADDLGTWSDDTFYLDLDFDGQEDIRFGFGMIGVRERPVAADMDQDGFDDLGLWVPDRSGAVPEESSEWYFLVSGGTPILNRIFIDPIRGIPVIEFEPVPFGEDVYARFGDEFAIPVVGNFDPPVAGGDAGRSDPGIVHLQGTAGADEFDFRPGAKPGSWLVTLNGDQQYIAAASVTVTFNGLGGNDLATITGTNGNERAVFDAGSASLTQPGVLALSVTNVERISIDGGGGSDTAILRDSNQNDSFVGRTNSGKLTYNNDPQHYAEALNFNSIVAVARYGGTDTADLHGSDGNDIFVGRTGWSTLRDRDPSGGDYRLSAKFFETTTAHAGDGTDRAFLHDSNRDDHFEGTADYGKLEFGDAPNHAVQANGFSCVVAYARAGGTDTGNLSDSEGNEKFIGRQTWSKLRSQDPSASGAYSHLLKFFETVTATAGNGGTDAAWLLGSPGNDTLVAGPASTTLSGWRFSNTAQGFPTVGVRGGGGNDEAYLSANGHDHLLAEGKLAQLTWDDTWVLSAYGFSYVEADGSERANNTLKKTLPTDYLLTVTGDWTEL